MQLLSRNAVILVEFAKGPHKGAALAVTGDSP